MRWTGILTTEGIPSMPYHIEGGDNVGSRPGHVTPDNVEVYLRGVIQVVSKVFILTKKEPRQIRIC